LVPAFDTALMMMPAFRPYSAEKALVCTLNSWIMSMFGWKVIWFCTMSLRLIPSNR
jgi:hypothetical protein